MNTVSMAVQTLTANMECFVSVMDRMDERAGGDSGTAMDATTLGAYLKLVALILNSVCSYDTKALTL